MTGHACGRLTGIANTLRLGNARGRTRRAGPAAGFRVDRACIGARPHRAARDRIGHRITRLTALTTGLDGIIGDALAPAPVKTDRAFALMGVRVADLVRRALIVDRTSGSACAGRGLTPLEAITGNVETARAGVHLACIEFEACIGVRRWRGGTPEKPERSCQDNEANEMHETYLEPSGRRTDSFLLGLAGKSITDCDRGPNRCASFHRLDLAEPLAKHAAHLA